MNRIIFIMLSLSWIYAVLERIVISNNTGWKKYESFVPNGKFSIDV